MMNKSLSKWTTNKIQSRRINWVYVDAPFLSVHQKEFWEYVKHML